MSNEDYVPFGPEWKKEMMKWRKEDLIEALRKALIYRSLTDSGKWYRWAEKLPPFDTELFFYSEESKIVRLGTWSYPECTNHEEVMDNLKSGEWKTHGINNLGSASHWYSGPPPLPPLPPIDKEDLCPNTTKTE